MTARVLRQRVDSLEDYMRELSYQSMRTEMELARLSKEMREFKDEMREFKDEMGAFKDEMREFKDESRQQNREMNRKWGDLANKLGTLVEDLVAPSLPRVIQEVFKADVLDLSVRRKRRLPDGRVREFDAIAVTAELVCLNSTKATLRSADVDALIGEIDAFRLFFPESVKTPVIGILATLAVDQSVLRHATNMGFLVLATGDELMEVMNPPGFEPRRW